MSITSAPAPRAEIHIRPFVLEDVPLYYEWAELPHVKSVWFCPGFQPKEYVVEKIDGKNGIDFPFTVLAGERPIGHICYWDIYERDRRHPEKQDHHTGAARGTYGLDLFIGDPDYLNKGYGTEIVRRFAAMLFEKYGATKLVIDPDPDNERACRCYEKAGFKVIGYAEEPIYGKSQIMVMEKPIPEA